MILVTNKEGDLLMKKIGLTKKVSLSLTAEEWEVLESYAADNEMSMSKAVRDLMDFASAEKKLKEPKESKVSSLHEEMDLHFRGYKKTDDDLEYFANEFAKALLIKKVSMRDRKLVQLMETMQYKYSIPLVSFDKFAEAYPEVISLYRSISLARSI